jgi:putative endonuclease
MGTSGSCPPADRQRRAAAARRTGQAAERAAARYLRAQGAQILLCNFRCRCGELDIVARCGEELAVVEVRSRASSAFGGAAASVDGPKRRRLVRAASRLLQVRPQWARMRIRFDVMTVEAPLAAQPRVEWIKHAFSAEAGRAPRI